MRKSRKRELMIEWFHQHFEDPAVRLPYESAEGGYQWIWGGPYNAREELHSKFSDLVSEDLITEVADEIESDGLTDWAPASSVDDYDQEQSPEDFEPPTDDLASFDEFLDEPSQRYGSAEDFEARVKAQDALEMLATVLDESRPPGMGHNGPPQGKEIEPEVEPAELRDLRAAVPELQAEFQKANPAIATVKRWAHFLQNAAIATGKWLLKKIDKAVDAAAGVIGVGFGTWLLAQISPPLHNALATVFEWLHIVAKTAF